MQRWMGTVDRSREFIPIIFITLIVTSSAFQSVAVAQSTGGSGPTIPQPTPGVDRTYDETYRILASDDSDPFYNTSTMEVPRFHPNGSVTIVNETIGTFPFEFDGENLRASEALELAYSTDLYRTTLQHRASDVPYADRWRSLQDYRDSGVTERTRVIPLQNVTLGTPTSIDGNYRVEVLNTNGEWNPVYDVEVEPDDSADGFRVTNPASAQVLLPEGDYVTRRHVDAFNALLRYSALASSDTAAHETAVVPMHEGSEIFPTTNGARAGLRWRGGRTLVKDAYIGVSDIPSSAWYRGAHVTSRRVVNARVPYDYRIDVPGNYRRRDTCTHTHRRGNTTYTETHPRTKWANYRLLNVGEDVTVSLSNGTYTQEMYRFLGPGSTWSTYEDSTSTLNHLSAGAYTLEATLTVEVELRERYGIRSSECNSYSRSRRLTQTLTTDYAVPVRLIDAHSPDLEIDATLYDKPGGDILSLEWSGDQDLTANPWRSITVTVGEKTLHFNGPWQFYSVSLNDAVEERSGSGTSTFGAGHSHGDRYPRLLYNRAAVTQTLVELDEPSEAVSWWREEYTDVDEMIPGTTLPATVIAPDNAEPAPAYEQYAGVIVSLDENTGESVSIEAETVFGFDVDQTSIDVVRYEETALDLDVQYTGGGNHLTVHLTDADTGTPISGRTIALQGASTDTVVTNSSGMATAVATGTNVRATFVDDDWQSTRSTYYLGDSAGVVTGIEFAGALTDVFGYINLGVSNTVLIIEWIGVGIFAFLWIRYRKRTQ
ncbi:Ig-like domain-containing protein (plasmid) [Halorientalis pallida]|uniref:Ig-like domain-containing protein n=1 Tax=Halorientalis pallida TaxID=2479928 RepID=UPI003C6ECD88